ncbi:MAG TPA: aryl-sulfate sulfotransferase [Bacteroidia bacterium]|nr:aryl-sulfate sulfotransferase [Bacteroidia bacterium]
MKITLPGLLLLLCPFVHSQTPTVGLIQHTGGEDGGYVLFAPISDTTTYLIDKCGKEIHSWTSAYRPGQSAYFQADGTLLRAGITNNPDFVAGGAGGIIEKLDWNSNVLWSYAVSDTSQCQHHDICALPDGNILVIAWEKKTQAEAIAAGRNPAFLGSELWGEKIVELQPVGNNSANIVWEWHLWDHLIQHYDSTKANYGIVGNNPQLVNINYSGSTAADWAHFNSIDYNPALDQIVVSVHNLNEIWVIDHSTTTAEAAGHTGGNSGKGGDILWRWGNPAAYNHGNASNKMFFGQHNAHWITPGLPHENEIMVFNNGSGRPAGNYSTVEIISPPVDSAGNYSSSLPYLPAAQDWIYADSVPANFYATNISGAQQLANGDVLICNGPAGTFFEIDSTMHTVWKYINPVSGTGILSQGSTPTGNLVFRSPFYYSSYSGFNSVALSAGQPIELNPYPYTCDLTGIKKTGDENVFSIYPNPSDDVVHISSGHDPMKSLCVIDLSGRVAENIAVNGTSYDLPVNALSPGIYFLQVTTSSGASVQRKLIVN